MLALPRLLALAFRIVPGKFVRHLRSVNFAAGPMIRWLPLADRAVMSLAADNLRNLVARCLLSGRSGGLRISHRTLEW